jgi:hypothetical protein
MSAPPKRRPPVEAASKSLRLVAIPSVVMVIARIIAVVAMMVIVMMVAVMAVVVVVMMVPSCSWYRAAGRDYANNA